MLKSALRTWVRSSVLRKGASGQSTFWAVVGVLGVLRSLHRRYPSPRPAPLLRSPIRPGEVIEVRYTGEPSRQVRKQRIKRAMWAERYAAAPDGRAGRKVRRRFADTLVSEDVRARP